MQVHLTFDGGSCDGTVEFDGSEPMPATNDVLLLTAWGHYRSFRDAPIGAAGMAAPLGWMQRVMNREQNPIMYSADTYLLVRKEELDGVLYMRLQFRPDLEEKIREQQDREAEGPNSA